MMTIRSKVFGAVAVVCASVASGVPMVPGAALAQSSMGSREFQQAELSEVSPAIRAEVERRATGGNTVRGVLETMLLNEIGTRWPGARIVATDMGRGVAVVHLPDNTLKAIVFNKQDGLQVVAEVTQVR
ncbi:hypothetical protein ACE7GA_12710 [Roseomonas sp. CCTCC AB2023176]|uniref:hypothetical protein n=1 Tax=Roseomonas sp. CCTCC AB2023176 TaxID=3342640 RepID=UPI0035E3413B